MQSLFIFGNAVGGATVYMFVSLFRAPKLASSDAIASPAAEGSYFGRASCLISGLVWSGRFLMDRALHSRCLLFDVSPRHSYIDEGIYPV